MLPKVKKFIDIKFFGIHKPTSHAGLENNSYGEVDIAKL